MVVDVGIGMCQAAPGYDSPLQIANDILQMIVQRKVCSFQCLVVCHILYSFINARYDSGHITTFEVIFAHIFCCFFLTLRKGICDTAAF